MKYIATYYVNGWSNVAPYVDHNKKQLCKDICEICKGVWTRGDFAHFEVINELKEIIFYGYILPNSVTQYIKFNGTDKF